jgi:hypothetical protein
VSAGLKTGVMPNVNVNPRSPLPSIAESFCRCRGRLPRGLPRETRPIENPEKGENIDAT